MGYGILILLPLPQLYFWAQYVILSLLDFFSLVPFIHLQWVFTSALRVTVLGTLSLHRLRLFLTGDKLDGSIWCGLPLRQNCSTALLGLNMMHPPSGLFPIFSVSTCWSCEERTWKKRRLPQILRPQEFYTCLSACIVFSNLPTILAELVLVVNGGIYPKWVPCIPFLSAAIIPS